MAVKKIEEVLLSRGLITARQLETALKTQLILGGHLGTCLLELGMIDEVDLGGALAETFGVPHAPSEVLQEIPEATIGILTAKVAEEYNVIPFRMAEGTLHMAMVDPGDLQVLDALSFATEKRIVPWVAPELRIYQALEKYYAIPRRSRYITICHALDRAGEQAERRRPAKSAARFDDQRKSAAGEGAETATSAASAVEAAFGGNAQDAAEEFDYGRNWHEVAAELHLDDVAPAREAAASRRDTAPTAPGRAPSADPSMSAPSLDDVAERLCRADGKDEIAEAVLGYAGARMPRCMLLGVQKGTASVWLARGIAIDPKRNVRLPIASGIFDLLVGNELYRGPLPKETAQGGFYRILGIEAPAEVLLIPIYLSDRLVAVFYGDGGLQGRVEGESDAYLRLFRLFGLSMKLLILKNQLRKAAHPPAEIRTDRRAVRKTTH